MDDTELDVDYESRVLEPLTLVDASLVSTNVPETAPTLYDSGTTYALGQTASVAATGNRFDVYTSLFNLNLNHSPATSPLWWKLTGTTYGLYNTSTIYADGDIVLYVASNVHEMYESQQGSNQNKPLSDGAWWVKLGPTNRWRLSDKSVGSQTTNPELMDYTWQLSDFIDAVAFLNVNASSLQVIMTHTVEGEVYNKTFSLTAPSDVGWYEYFTEPITRLKNFIVTDLPTYGPNTTLRFKLTEPGGNPALGVFVVGRMFDLGEAQYGLGLGLLDFSVKEPDDYGGFELLERAYSQTGSFPIWVNNQRFDSVIEFLNRIRATPVVFVGSELYSSTFIYGFLQEYNQELAGQRYSVLSLDVNGLS